jgi:hypothetical protein
MNAIKKRIRFLVWTRLSVELAITTAEGCRCVCVCVCVCLSLLVCRPEMKHGTTVGSDSCGISRRCVPDAKVWKVNGDTA